MEKTRMSVEEYRKKVNGQAAKEPKYHNRKTVVDGINFDSQAEANHYCENKLKIKAGKLKYQLLQVPFHLPGGYIHKLDFGEVTPFDFIEFVEVKGKDLPMGKMKRRQVEEIYGINIKVIS